jgi:prepilin-type N-terminal cleavage/methylation domain-containing protein
MRTERGFSLVELMVAMTVTLIVSGAIYGLLTSGSNAFRREPEVADRQQNIRAALDLVSRDVFGAGAALPTFAQVFTRSDPDGACAGGLNGCGVAGTMGPAAAADRGGDGEETDVLEIVSTDEQCPDMTLCPPSVAAGTAGLYVAREAVPGCLRLPGLVLLADNGGFTVQAASLPTGALTACTGGAAPPNSSVLLGASLPPWQGALQALGATPSQFLYRARVVRYRIAPGTDPVDPTPALWRSETGRYGTDGVVQAEPGEGGFSLAGSPWELVARGIEDLQIEYRGGAGVWQNDPPIATTNDWTSLVRQVRITLSARATAPNLQGQTRAGGGAPDAVRGQLQTVVTPRAAFLELQMGSQIQ